MTRKTRRHDVVLLYSKERSQRKGPRRQHCPRPNRRKPRLLKMGKERRLKETDPKWKGPPLPTFTSPQIFERSSKRNARRRAILFQRRTKSRRWRAKRGKISRMRRKNRTIFWPRKTKSATWRRLVCTVGKTKLKRKVKLLILREFNMAATLPLFLVCVSVDVTWF